MFHLNCLKKMLVRAQHGILEDDTRQGLLLCFCREDRFSLFYLFIYVGCKAFRSRVSPGTVHTILTMPWL